MANPSLIPTPDAPDSEVAAFFRLVIQLRQAVLAGQVAAVAPPVRRRPPREHVGPSPVYQELEQLLGYQQPTGYRASPSRPIDFDPPRAAGPVA